MKIFLLGYPGSIGGANTECWHTLKLWKKNGCQITAIPTWEITPWKTHLDLLGIPTVETEPDKIAEVPGLAGSIVVSFCNQHAAAVSARLNGAGCKLVWVNCMTFLFQHELAMARFGGMPAAWIYHTEFQRQEIEPYLHQFGYRNEQGHIIRGAFDIEEWPYNPRERRNGEVFTIGKIARPDEDKWHQQTWEILSKVLEPKKTILMGVNKKIRNFLGESPPWGQYIEPNGIPVINFYRHLDCLLCLNGFARENWPRVGLEAMACGVPVIAPDSWGWKEMIVDGFNGRLYKTTDEIPKIIEELKGHEKGRLALTSRARIHLERELANPEIIWDGWKRVFESLQ